MIERVTKDKNLVRLFLDSGAFGAWSRGKEIDVRDYIDYIKDNERFIWNYVNLDVIPGKFGRRDNSQREVEESAVGSYKNQKIMKKAGLHPIPVFHQGERMHWLEQFLRDGEPYIGLSASKFVRVDEQKRWLDMCFARLCDKQGRPLVKTHGFALTAYPLLTSYPWYTVDSTTWSLTPGYGQIIIPAYIKGKPDYLHPPIRIAISGVTHKSVSSQKKQFENLGPKSQDAVTRFLEEEVGCTVAEARYGTNFRRRAMLVYYMNLCNVLKGVHYTGPRASISGKDHYDTSHMKALEPFNLILTFATSLNREWSDLMTEVGANSRLLSYWEMQDRSNAVVQQYVLTGTHGKYQRAKIRPDWSETYLNRRRLGLLDTIKRLDNEESAHIKNGGKSRRRTDDA